MVDSVDWFDAATELQFDPLLAEERDRAILSVMRELESELVPSGSHRLPAWEHGWGEILERVGTQGLTYKNLMPQYFRHPIMRLRHDYVRVAGDRFEFALSHAIKVLLYTAHIRNGDLVVDLGTGTASNVYLLLKLFDRSEVIGCDWARQSNELTDQVGMHFGKRARGASLDMLTLDGLARLGDFSGGVVVSVHAFEQLGSGFASILSAILEGRPRLVIQIEPILENYNPDLLVDYLAIRYHKKRNFLTGYLTALRGLQVAGRVEILTSLRVPAGNIYHEPYGILVWQPL